jgi:predicted Zn finger-like uncharacterized protein
MDVTCEQCKAEYDFDDTLLGDKGTTVKCSQCGHVFRVLPRRREPQRSALKVRFARDGHVEAVSSLRELQQRIQAGDVGVEDELGRDGFTFRKLRDVPELKNFFGRGAGPSNTPAARGPTELLQPPEAHAKRTVLGLGTSAHDVPTSPRMQGLGPGGGLAAQALAPTQPGGPAPRATIQGRAPVSSAPTTPSQPAARELPSRRVPISSAPTPSGTAPTIAGSAPLYGATSNNAPTVVPPPSTYPETDQRPAPAGPVLRVPESERPDGRLPEPRRGSSGDSIGPGALRAAAQPRTTSAPPAGPGRKVRLRVEDDDSPPERAAGGSSKMLVAIGLFALLGVGGLVASRRLSSKLETVEPAPAAAPELAVDAASAAPLAEPPAALGADAALAAPALQAPPQPTPAAPTPEPEPAATPSATQAPDKSDKTGASKPAAAATARAPEKAPDQPAAASGGREPKDYSGWVARGGQLLSRGDITGARQAFETAVALRATGSEANSGLGSVLLALGQTREAIPYLDRAASSGFAEAAVGLGDAYRKLGQSEAAIEAYETYLARMPKGARANYVRLQLEGLGRREKAGEAPPPPRAEAPSRPSDEYRPAGELTETPPTGPSSPPPAENTP